MGYILITTTMDNPSWEDAVWSVVPVAGLNGQEYGNSGMCLPERLREVWCGNMPFAFNSRETGYLGPMPAREMVDALMEEICDTVPDDAPNTDDHPLEEVRSAIMDVAGL